MATLISVHNSEGWVGRCDARCYEAKDQQCDCICGGSNHGAGLKRAQQNTRKMGSAWIERWKRTHPGKEFSFDLPKAAMQGTLF